MFASLGHHLSSINCLHINVGRKVIAAYRGSGRGRVTPHLHASVRDLHLHDASGALQNQNDATVNRY